MKSMKIDKNYKLLIFDWDGTLADSSSFIVNSYKDTAIELGFKEPSDMAIKATFGKNAAGCLQELYPDCKDISAAVECFYKNYLKNIKQEKLFDGAIELLQDFKSIGYLLAIATNKRREALTLTLANNNLKDLFVAMRCGDDEFVKPNPQVLNSLMLETNVTSSETVMIGDTAVDMLVAKTAKVDAIAACYGGSKKDELVKYSPVAVIENLKELKNILVKS